MKGGTIKIKHKMKQDNAVKITLIIVAGIILLSLIGFLLLSNTVLARTVSTTGIASLSVVPDRISVYFNVETDGKTATEAKDSNSEIADNLITELIKLGFERKDIQTEHYNIYPEYEWRNGNRYEDGYKAVHSIKVVFSSDDKNLVGDAIDAGVESGASISYINFELSQELENQYKAEAIGLATKDARQKAEAIASGLNKRLGTLVSVSDQNFDYNPWRLYDFAGAEAMGEDVNEAAKAAATSINPSERQVSARVSVTYKI